MNRYSLVVGAAYFLGVGTMVLLVNRSDDKMNLSTLNAPLPAEAQCKCPTEETTVVNAIATNLVLCQENSTTATGICLFATNTGGQITFATNDSFKICSGSELACLSAPKHGESLVSTVSKSPFFISDYVHSGIQIDGLTEFNGHGSSGCVLQADCTNLFAGQCGVVVNFAANNLSQLPILEHVPSFDCFVTSRETAGTNGLFVTGTSVNVINGHHLHAWFGLPVDHARQNGSDAAHGTQIQFLGTEYVGNDGVGITFNGSAILANVRALDNLGVDRITATEENAPAFESDLLLESDDHLPTSDE